MERKKKQLRNEDIDLPYRNIISDIPSATAGNRKRLIIIGLFWEVDMKQLFVMFSNHIFHPWLSETLCQISHEGKRVTKRAPDYTYEKKSMAKLI